MSAARMSLAPTPPNYRLVVGGPGLGCNRPSISGYKPHFGRAKSKSRPREGAMTFTFPFDKFFLGVNIGLNPLSRVWSGCF